MYNSNGSIERYMVRLVIKRYTQIYEIDYQKIFAPKAKMNTIKILLSIMVKPRMEHLSN
jgi:hypothetical protein